MASEGSQRRRGVVTRAYDRLAITLLRAGLPFPPYSRKNALVMETIGHRTGTRRLIPMGYLRRTPNRLLVVAERGERSAWLRNALAAGSVRLWIGRRGYRGTVTVREDVDPEEVLAGIGSRFHAAAIRRIGEAPSVVELLIDGR
jgi:deazaflavin-dependent oxidoreductase (nitroreductase family)